MRPEKVDPLEPIANVDALVHGVDATRCRYTGWPIVRSIGAWPSALQEEANKVFYEQVIKITKVQAQALADQRS
jgi:hypothetical protein